MTLRPDASLRIAAGLSLVFGLMSPPLAASLQSKKPATIVRCLPPGGKVTVPCRSLSAGSMIELRAQPDRSRAPAEIYFREVSATGRPRTARAKLQVKWFVDHASLKAVVPQTLCAGAAKGQQLQFEIQLATSDMNQAESGGDADSVGFFQMRC